jgi:hypothetical protein
MESPMMGSSEHQHMHLFTEARDVCRDMYCAQNKLPLSKKADAVLFKVSETLVEIFSVEMEAMLVNLREALATGSDEDRKIAVGDYPYSMFQIVEEQVSTNTTAVQLSLVHWHVLESVHRIANETEWSKEQLDNLLEQAGNWTAEKINLRGSGSSSEKAKERADIVSSMLGELGLPVATLQISATCSEFCDSNWDGVCNDGGAGSESGSCNFGTDCLVSVCHKSFLSLPATNPFYLYMTIFCHIEIHHPCLNYFAARHHPPSSLLTVPPSAPRQDCGDRDGVNPPTLTCVDSCFLFGDGICDDGGPGAESYACIFGTDCQVGNFAQKVHRWVTFVVPLYSSIGAYTATATADMALPQPSHHRCYH